MLDDKCFKKEWIGLHGAALGCRNPVMLEKAIVAFQLLGSLAESGIPFQFKGGTSLLLRLNPLRRLSIDVDIVTQASPDMLRRVLDDVAGAKPFISYLHDSKRDGESPPKKHYKVSYPSAVESKNDHILLDVLFEQEGPPGCELVLIRVPFIEPLREVTVAVPTVNHLLGDKLTAFAPETIGILYHPDRNVDIVKQLFDVGVLFDAASDLCEVATAYDYMHKKQLGYRKKSYTLSDTLSDTMNAAFTYSQPGLRGGMSSPHADLMQAGVKRLQNHLLNLPFAQTEARIAAAKAACLAAWLQHRPPGMTFSSLRFSLDTAADVLRDKRILAPWGPLDRLKGGNPEAFHYWHQAQQILRSRGGE